MSGVHTPRPLGVRAAAHWLAAAMVCLVPAAATAKQPVPPPAALHDMVTATGSGTYLTFIAFNVQSGPSGENPTGTATWGVPGDHTYIGPVTCLAVSGNTAIVNVDAVVFGLVTVTLTDNGGDGQDSVKMSSEIPRSPTDCSPPAFNGINDTLTNGRVTVVDAPALPTLKLQCKHGGWARFGFANQGQCIRSVSRL